jgi:hypothetical protein
MPALRLLVAFAAHGARLAGTTAVVMTRANALSVIRRQSVWTNRCTGAFQCKAVRIFAAVSVYPSMRVICLGALGFVVFVNPGPVEACKPLDLRGNVKSVIESEVPVDAATGTIGTPRVTNRIDVSQDGRISEMAWLSPSGRVISKSSAHFEGGKEIRRAEVSNGKTVSTTTCSYDAAGRLTEDRTQSERGERNVIETYEYGDGFIRRRVQAFGGPSVITQTLDAAGRVIKEVVVEESTAKVARTADVTYSDNKEQRCEISARTERRHCFTTSRDSQGNVVEVGTEGGTGRTLKTSFEYDSAGNWISKRTVITDGSETVTDRIVRRNIEYW